MSRFIFGIAIGVLLVPAAIWLWLTHGHPPVAVTDPPLPYEQAIVNNPLHARIERERIANPPVPANETTFVAGAHVYLQQCSFCHGTYGETSAAGQHMFPGAPGLWQKHEDNVVGVSDDSPAGETYWKVANGIRLSGMPAYKQILSDTEMWQVSVLLANADKPLPPAALILLKQKLDLDPAAKPGVAANTTGQGWSTTPVAPPKPAQVP